VRVALHPEVSVTVTANVAQSAEEAEMQAKGIDPLRAREEEDEELQATATPQSPSSQASAMRGEGEPRAARG
jgi:large subunit ribosomal protein L9